MKLIIKKSKIAGKGVFTQEPIKKGEKIYLLKGKVYNLNQILKKMYAGKEEESDPLGIGWEKYLDLEEFSRTFNHSCNPNAYIRGKSELVAIRNIKSGEEITYDYSTTMHDNAEKLEKKYNDTTWTHPCKCGAKKCRGIIDQFKTLPKKRQQYYLKNKYAPDFILKAFG